MAYLTTRDAIKFDYKGKTYTVARSDGQFVRVRDLLDEDRTKEAVELVDPAHRLRTLDVGGFRAQEGAILYQGQPVDSTLANVVLKLLSGGGDFQPLLRFYKRLKLNPSYRSVQQLYRYVERNHITVVPDGRMLVLKNVRPDLTDWHTGKNKHPTGAVLGMLRNEVSDDADVACHAGLHVGGWDYVKNFNTGGVILAMLVDPADVVCVPKDSSYGKIRVCKYEVLGPWAEGKALPSGIFDLDILTEEWESAVKEKVVLRPFLGSDIGTETLTDSAPPEEDDEDDEDDEDAYESMSIADLRKYAAQKGMTGASKIPGGKAALIQRLREYLKGL